MATTNTENEEIPSTNSNETLTDEQITKILDSTNFSTTVSEEVKNDETQSKPTRTPQQSAIGAKVAKKLETLAANSKQSNGKDAATNSTSNETEIPRNVIKTAKNIVKNLSDSDPQKNYSTLATRIAELQEQNRVENCKINELEKRIGAITRERDQYLLENGRNIAAKTKLESLCRELHRHNQQIRDESTQRQRDDELKRRELATKFQTTIDEIASQLSSYSEKSTLLREQNVQLSEQLNNVVKDYELREKEMETTLKKRELELRLTETNLEHSHTLLTERTELIKQERQVSEAERLVLYKKCEELAASELSLRSQVTMYSERYQEFQKAIQQSSQMVTSCHEEIEKMGKKIKHLEKERNDFRHRFEVAESNQKKAQQDYKLLEKEKRQLESKLDKLDKLSRALQQERIELQTTIKTLSKSSTNSNGNDSKTSAETQPADSPPINGHEQAAKTDSTIAQSEIDQSANLYDSELGRIAKTVD